MNHECVIRNVLIPITLHVFFYEMNDVNIVFYQKALLNKILK